jgi:hypothetical protein
VSEQNTSDRDITTWAGLAVVGVAAAVLSFSALSDLARLCGITGVIEVHGVRFQLSWLLPITVDVLAAVTTRVWLRAQAAREAVAFARRAAWAAIGATVGGNAYHGALVESGSRPPLLACVLVSAVPAVVLGGLVHLAVLVGRPAGEVGESEAAEPGRLRRLLVTAWSWLCALFTRDSSGGDTDDERANPGDVVLPEPPPRGAPYAVQLADLQECDRLLRAAGRPVLKAYQLRDRYRAGQTRATELRSAADRLHIVPTGATGS